MTLREGIKFLQSLNKLSSIKDTEFSLILYKNFKIVKDKVDLLEELLNKEVPEYNSVVKKINKLKTKYKKAENKEELEVEYNDYIEEVEDIINDWKEKEEEYLNKELNIKLHVISDTKLPNSLSTQDIHSISPMIKFS